MIQQPLSHDPWPIERERAAQAPGFRRPDLTAVPRRSLYLLGILAAVRVFGLVLIAEAIARGLGGLAAATTADLRLILGWGGLGALLRAGGDWATVVVSRRVASDVKQRLRRRLLTRIASGDTASGGTAVLASEALDDLDDYFTQTLPAVIAAAVIPLLVGARILGADWLSAAVIIITVPLVPLFMILIGKHTQLRTDAALAALIRLADHLTELARGLPVLVGLGRIDDQSRALDAIQAQYRSRTETTLRWAFLSALALELIATISVAVVAVFLGLRLLNGTMDLEPALLALLLAPECFTALRDVGSAFHASQDGLSALERATTVLSRPPARDVRSTAESPMGIHRLRVRYRGRDEVALGPITADLVGITAVSGASGSGKSTLLAALAGTLPADAEVTGQISGVRGDQVAWAPQPPCVFASSPREELARYGATGQAMAEVGLDRLGEVTIADMSPGELRRLAVARSLARVDAGARLLLLDEPTAHLDADAAELVRTAIRRRANRCVIVLASHESATLALADHTLTLPSAAPCLPGEDPVAAAADQVPAPPTDHPETPIPATGPASGRLTLGRLLRPQWGTWVAATLLGSLSVGLGAALTAVSGWLIVRASIEEHLMYLMVAIVGVRAFGIGRAVSRYAERLLTHRAALHTIDELRLQLWRAIAARGAGSRRFLDGGAPLDYLVTLADDLRDQLPRILPQLGAGLLTLAGVITATTFLAPHLVVVVATALVGACAVATALTTRAERGASTARVAARSEILRGTAALAGAARDLRGNGVAAAAVEDLDLIGQRLADAEYRAAWSASLGTTVVTLTTVLVAVAVPVLSPGLAAEQASALTLLILASVEPLTALITAVRRLPTLHQLLSRLNPALARTPQPAWGHTPAPRVSEVGLEQVTIRYPGATAPAVSDVSATAHRERWLVITGPSGSGKSTLLSAIMGALRVDRGQICANHSPITGFTETSWRAKTAWCPQEAYIFGSTIRGNLLLACPQDEAHDDETLRVALHRAGLGPLLASLPLGLDTHVGAAGSALSGGERQRLAVARALLTRADVLLLDEPTAHLDDPTAAAMMADLRAATAGRVVILVSHRAADRSPSDALVELGETTRASEDRRGLLRGQLATGTTRA
ncbi:MAG: thiol reductant ABC exporter subunit CydC [Propioniciclava sp.]